MENDDTPCIQIDCFTSSCSLSNKILCAIASWYWFSKQEIKMYQVPVVCANLQDPQSCTTLVIQLSMSRLGYCSFFLKVKDQQGTRLSQYSPLSSPFHWARVCWHKLHLCYLCTVYVCLHLLASCKGGKSCPMQNALSPHCYYWYRTASMRQL